MFFPFFLIIDFKYLILATVTQVFNPTAELALPIKIPTKEAKTEIKTHSVAAKVSISDCSM